MMRLTVLGCSGSYPGPDNPASSYLLETDDPSGRIWRILIDLGNGAFGTLLKVVDPTELDALVISHLHPDHYLDITGLEVFLAYHERDDLEPLPVYAPADLPQRLNTIQDRPTNVPAGVDTSPFDYRSLSEGGQFHVGPVEFETRLVEHPVEAYGFRISNGHQILAYSGDSDECASLAELAANADAFLCEAGYIEGRDDHFTGIHLTGRRAGQTAREANVAKLLLTHIPAWTDPQVPLAEASAEFTGPIRVIKPLDRLEIGR